MSEIKSISELARVLKSTRQSVRTWTHLPGFPGGVGGPWGAQAVDEYLEANRLGPYRMNGPIDETDGEGNDNDLHALRCAKMKQEVIRLELDNLERQRLLSDPTEQIRLFALACQAICTGLENLKARCRPKLVGLKDEHTIEEILGEEIAVLIGNLRDWTLPEEQHEQE